MHPTETKQLEYSKLIRFLRLRSLFERTIHFKSKVYPSVKFIFTCLSNYVN